MKIISYVIAVIAGLICGCGSVSTSQGLTASKDGPAVEVLPDAGVDSAHDLGVDAVAVDAAVATDGGQEVDPVRTDADAGNGLEVAPKPVPSIAGDWLIHWDLCDGQMTISNTDGVLGGQWACDMPGTAAVRGEQRGARVTLMLGAANVAAVFDPSGRSMAGTVTDGAKQYLFSADGH